MILYGNGQPCLGFSREITKIWLVVFETTFSSSFFANLAGIAWVNSVVESVIGDEKDDRMR